MSQQVFISYSHSDADFANELCKAIESAGYEVWLDRTDIQTGSHWDDEIVKGLNASQLFLILLSNRSVASQNVKDEIGYAIDHNMQILPVLLEACDIPFRLKRYQYVDVTSLKEKNKTILENVKSMLPISKPEKEKKTMDPITLAATVTTILSPFIKKAGEAAAEKIGEKFPDSIGKIWSAVSKKSDNVAEAATDLAKNPDDADNEVVLKKQLQKAFEKDQELAEMIAELVEKTKSEANISNIGDGAVATDHSNAVGKIEIGGDLSGNITIGNGNSINSNK
ncbi:MAG: toll/interleukin-1 receptor domain-containing protein [Anaerolineales bacterium]|nr:toll/interleukin-1 receptor domain-containing protein [Anaerolineales bacterium]